MALVLLALIVTLLTLGYFVWRILSVRQTPDAPVERSFITDDEGTTAPFPSILDRPSKLLSVVAPAYNEAERIEVFLDDIIAYLSDVQAAKPSFTWEIIIVDDGSRDNTVGIAQKYMLDHGADAVRVLQLACNHGKGGAVRKGMLRARGKYILMADSDGATAAHEVSSLLAELERIEEDGQGIAVGSRAHLQSAEDGKAAARSPLRILLMKGFHLLLHVCMGNASAIDDTQCGFKMFTRDTAAALFSNLHIQRWAFDVELFVLAGILGNIPMAEVPVEWNEIPGSKVDLLWDSLKMARDLLTIRLAYSTGLWKLQPLKRSLAKSKSS